MRVGVQNNKIIKEKRSKQRKKGGKIDVSKWNWREKIKKKERKSIEEKYKKKRKKRSLEHENQLLDTDFSPANAHFDPPCLRLPTPASAHLTCFVPLVRGIPLPHVYGTNTVPDRYSVTVVHILYLYVKGYHGTTVVPNLFSSVLAV